MKGFGASQKQNTVCGDNLGQNIVDKLQFLCEIAPYGKSSVSIFQEIFAGIDDKILISGVRLSTEV